MIRVGILTSSRADYGIYLPLLKALQKDKDFDLKIISFGAHVSKFHGYTIRQIKQDGFPITKIIESLLTADTPNAVASSYALTIQKFADYWEQAFAEFDIVFALGDRFEMAAAVSSSIPFGLKIAHLYGGETTLGAIDNIYRHYISLASSLHFVSTDTFANRLRMLLDDKTAKIHNVGSLSLENLETIKLLTIGEFKEKWQIDLSIPTLLFTVHPETVDYTKNNIYCQEISKAIEVLSKNFQIVITMPNADTAGLLYREAFLNSAEINDTIKLIENFGTQSYFTCMYFCKLMIGNTSSGIVEAASFRKYVLNIGDRQKGRLCSDNIIHLPFKAEMIIENAKEYAKKEYLKNNIYYKHRPSEYIIKTLKKEYASLL